MDDMKHKIKRVEEQIDGGQDELFEAYQIVWAQFGNHPPWPGVLLDKYEWHGYWAELAKKPPLVTKELIYWLGDGKVSYVGRGDIYNYCVHYDEFIDKTNATKGYHLAVIEANSIVAELNDSSMALNVSAELIEGIVKNCPKAVIKDDEQMFAVISCVRENRKFATQKKGPINSSQIGSMLTEKTEDEDVSTTSPPPSPKKKIYSLLACVYCNKQFRSSLLMAHLNYEHFGWRFQCVQCRAIVNCQSRSECPRHPECSNSARPSNWQYVRIPKLENFSYNEFQTKKWHAYKHLKVDEESDDDDDDDLLCETCVACWAKFSDELQLKNHLINSSACLKSAEICSFDVAASSKKRPFPPGEDEKNCCKFIRRDDKNIIDAAVDEVLTKKPKPNKPVAKTAPIISSMIPKKQRF